jgi:phosphoglycolate phosphatase-like HAD superfamily hydrolase
MKYKCLILDHDDTAVNSTEHIHHPAHVEIMRVLRPGQKAINLEGWLSINFEPGLMHYLEGELGFTGDDVKKEYEIWRSFTSTIVPDFYPGFLETLAEYKSRGGVITVISHSEVEFIYRDYRTHGGDMGIEPEMVFGWDYDETKRKPSPYPVQQILKKFGLKPEETLIIDDLKPGVLMSQASGVQIAAAGWAHQIPEIVEYMKKNCITYFPAVEDFRHFILDG